MASSFDEVSHEDRVFGEVMALYNAIKDTPGIMKVRRAEMRQGEVKALPIDFVIDVELKAKRALLNDPYGQTEWSIVLGSPDQYQGISVLTREILGREFNSCNLGVEGAYRMLYWRAKNNKQDNKQEVANGIFE